MRRFALIALIALPFPAAADWTVLSGEEIRTALTGRTLEYKNARQDFRASGKTLYVTNGRDSWGNWRIEDDQYCSQWPPSDLWACYAMDRQGDVLRFVGERDDITEATYVD
ncbi:hypothetical protein [uncultured Tateyamaria sp.]|uniref:hypothetical protein n=1 Tax=uncultured Tateyamaria sp. TaxID=455651 RepID=UPI002618EE48|nr:hypothetical protein [uncultured Tateyamaria sp.]